LETVNFDQVR